MTDLSELIEKLEAVRTGVRMAKDVIAPVLGSATYKVAGRGQVRVLMGKQEFDLAREADLHLSLAIDGLTEIGKALSSSRKDGGGEGR